MVNIIRIGNKDTKLMSNAGTAFFYKSCFGGDILRDLNKNIKDDDESKVVELSQQLAYIMSRQAEGLTMKELRSKLSNDDYIEWLCDFEASAFYDGETVGSIITAWRGNLSTTGEAKNEQSPQ